VPYLLGEYRERAPERRLRRPYRDRTGVLLIESQASVPLLRRPKVLLRPSSNRDPPGFSRALYLLSLAGMSVCGAEGARTPGLRSAEPALNLLSYSPMSPEPGNRTRHVLLPKQAGYPAPSLRIARAGSPRDEGRRPGVLCYAIRCGILKHQHHRTCRSVIARAAGIEPATHGFGDRRSTELSYTRIRKWRRNGKRRLSRSGRRRVARLACRATRA
jgi:hypothetical protein